MEIIIRIYKQLKASEIYPCNDGQWKGLYDKFEDNNIRNGIYFYTYGDSRIPFYIGKSTAKSYNILGRVWEELDQCSNGFYWFPRDVNRYKDAECYKMKNFKDVNYINNNFFAPSNSLKSDTEFQKQLKLYLDNVIISFSYLELLCDDVERNQKTNYLESYLQERLKYNEALDSGWIGDGGSNLTKVPLKDIFPVFKYTNNNLIELNFNVFK